MNKPMTVADLRAALEGVPEYVWVVLEDGPAQIIDKELGASEPFLLLRCVRQCLHGVPIDENCVPCEVVKTDMRK